MIAFLLAAASLAPSPALQETFSWEQTLDAIRVVETGGEPDEGRGAKGDGGASLGPYQIQRAYFLDSRVKGSHKDVLHDMELSRLVVRGYMNRYNREALKRLEAGRGTMADVLKTARIHNGGPKGHRKDATQKYADKIRKEIQK